MYETKMSKDFGEDINKLYRRKSDKLMLGDIPLSFIEYLTNRGRICKVQIFFYGTENLEKMEKILRYAYGPPNQTYPPYNLQWIGKKVMLFYTKTKDYEGRPWGVLEFHSTPIFYEDSSKAKSKINSSIQKGASEL